MVLTIGTAFGLIPRFLVATLRFQFVHRVPQLAFSQQEFDMAKPQGDFLAVS